MTVEQFLERLSELSKPGQGFKPHKHMVLLSVLRLVRQGLIRTPQIYFDDAFRTTFSEVFEQYAGEADRDRPCAPFYHLASHEFWRLVPNEGQESALNGAATVGSPGDLQRLVNHAEIDQSVFDLLGNPETSNKIEREIELLIRLGIESRSQPAAVRQERAGLSLFAHEAAALDAIHQYVEAHKLGEILCNLELHDPQSNRYFETDLVVVARFGVYAVELKHWSGHIEVRPNSWLQNGSFFKPDPHKANNFKAKLLRGLYEHRFPQFPAVYFESVVVLTNPEVAGEGCSIPTTTAHNPTFEGIDRFLRYLKNQRQAKEDRLTEMQCQAFANYVRKLHTAGPPRDFVFPGYEIVERLYQYDDRAEVVARRTDIRHRRLSRLRIFYLPAGDENNRLLAHERATATLNAVAKIGDHPNVLKVWDVPNENNYLVEGSDWSETGTLRDLLEREKPLKLDLAAAIAGGLARGLDAVHRQCVVHRALSPDNVLMVDETPKLMNFDLSFQLEENRVTVIPDATKLKRSPYIAPEIYEGGIIPEATADLFSLGVILYEMLVGRPPFGCSTDLERSNGVLIAEYRQQLKQRGVPTRIVDLVFDLVRQDPHSRPAEAKAVLARLEGDREAAPAMRETNLRLPAGAQCGLYCIDQFIRCGTEAQIYLAVGAQGRKVALKLFNSDVALQRVVEEQRFAAAIRHYAIVRVGSANQWNDGRYYIPFDWVSERSLRDEIADGVRPDVDRFVRVADQILDALAALHQNVDEGRPSPILHNDIKPENILLGEGDRPVLVDFGAASSPHVGTYEGTEGYVAPDLRLGQDRKYSEDGDLYALSVTLHEWLLGYRSAQEADSAVNVPQAVLDWLRRGSAAEATQRFASVLDMREVLRAAVAPKQPSPVPAPHEGPTELPLLTVEPEPQEPERLRGLPEGEFDPNPFVPYLNSLHSRSAGTENALAEAQAQNRFFAHIHVPHPLAMVIQEALLGAARRHVILTGHAGDGKSTIAVEIFKRLAGVPPEAPLLQPLNRREDLTADGKAVSLVKDFSEWSTAEREGLMAELLNTAGSRFLVISNTGTLLDAFKAHERAMHGDWVRVESDLLGAMNTSRPSETEFHKTSFVLINVAMVDNLGIAEQIFHRMLSPERWKACASPDCSRHCPIYRNVSLIQENMPVVRNRLFLAYRRMYEYGRRLTLRQLCAHMAYMITSGLSYPEIVKMSQRARPPLMAEFMFFNRFFGDNGKDVDGPAMQLRAVRAVREQGFGSHPCPTWERRLWLRSRGETFKLAAAKYPDDFETIQKHGSGLLLDEAVSGEQGREQIRRAVFFLHDFGKTDDGSFLKAFLRSVMLLDFARWQTQEDETLSLQEASSLHRRIMHVLQEHFTGVRLPEGASSDRHLFVTLSRRSHDVRQSAQVVLARYPEDDFQVRLRTIDNGVGGIRRDLALEGNGHQGDLRLPLALPFLDYVMMRNQGEVGRDLQASYIDRLERFKGQLIRCSAARRSDDIMLVRLRTNHTFRRQIFAVRGGRLEVTDA